MPCRLVSILSYSIILLWLKSLTHLDEISLDEPGLRLISLDLICERDSFCDSHFALSPSPFHNFKASTQLLNSFYTFGLDSA
jgi:hypothetical protein